MDETLLHCYENLHFILWARYSAECWHELSHCKAPSGKTKLVWSPRKSNSSLTHLRENQCNRLILPFHEYTNTQISMYEMESHYFVICPFPINMARPVKLTVISFNFMFYWFSIFWIKFKLIHFKIISALQNNCTIVQRTPLYPSPSFLRCYWFSKSQYDHQN